MENWIEQALASASAVFYQHEDALAEAEAASWKRIEQDAERLDRIGVMRRYFNHHDSPSDFMRWGTWSLRFQLAEMRKQQREINALQRESARLQEENEQFKKGLNNV